MTNGKYCPTYMVEGRDESGARQRSLLEAMDTLELSTARINNRADRANFPVFVKRDSDGVIKVMPQEDIMNIDFYRGCSGAMSEPANREDVVIKCFNEKIIAVVIGGTAYDIHRKATKLESR